ncbi:MAG: hypothetical protein ACI9UR_001660 [Bacteroidia bacterium]|jgi:hypothetical protein
MIKPPLLKALFAIAASVLLFSQSTLAQDNVGIGTTTPHENAILDASSVEKGLLIPRMNTLQRLGINPVAGADGLLVYDTDQDQFWHWDGTQWVQSTGPAGPIGPAGADGAAGANGATGGAGPQGAAGANGTTGSAGADGANGANGATGAAGANGATGGAGPQGAAGANGTTGSAGADGANGANGATGATGAAGAAGANGAAGATGVSGAIGPAGAAGAAGANGVTGPTGPAASNNTETVNLSSQSQLTATSTGTISYVQLPNLTYTFTVPAGETWHVHGTAFGTALNLGSFDDCVAQFEIFENGTGTTKLQRAYIGDSSTTLTFAYGTWAISYANSFGPGTYTLDVRGAHAGPAGGTNIQLAGGVGGFQSHLELLIVR